MASKRVFSAKFLKHLEKAHPIEEFTAQFKNEFWRTPKFSLRQQADLRKACLINSIDPKSIGLPEKVNKSKTGMVQRNKPPKGHKQQRNYLARQEEIQNALDTMPKKIQQWKNDLAKEKEKFKPSLPF